MRILGVLIAAMLFACLSVADEPLPKDVPWMAPIPQRLEMDEESIALKARLNDLLHQLEMERNALGAAHDSVGREYENGLDLGKTGDPMIKLRIKELLGKLHRKQQTGPGDSVGPAAPGPGPGATAKPPGSASSALPLEKAFLLPSGKGEPNSPSVDPLTLGQALFRVGNFEGAYRAFQMIDLKGTRADQRAPVLYLMASCLRRQGKTQDAIARYTEVANILGDEQVAACAQWQLAALRWQKETVDRIADVKQRRVALERSR